MYIQQWCKMAYSEPQGPGLWELRQKHLTFQKRRDYSAGYISFFLFLSQWLSISFPLLFPFPPSLSPPILSSFLYKKWVSIILLYINFLKAPTAFISPILNFILRGKKMSVNNLLTFLFLLLFFKGKKTWCILYLASRMTCSGTSENWKLQMYKLM